MNTHEHRRRQLLADYRDAIAPHDDDAARAWARLQSSPDDATPEPLARPGRGAWWWGLAALAAAAAAVWLARPAPDARVAAAASDRELSEHVSRDADASAVWGAAPTGAPMPAELPRLHVDPTGSSVPVRAPSPREPSPASSAPTDELSAAASGPREPPAPADAPRAADAIVPADAARPGDSLRAELDAIAQAREALDRGEPKLAIARIAEHRRRFPAGALAIEAAAIRAAALCRSGAPAQGRAEARALLERSEAAAYRALLRESCGLQ